MIKKTQESVNTKTNENDIIEDVLNTLSTAQLVLLANMIAKNNPDYVEEFKKEFPEQWENVKKFIFV